MTVLAASFLLLSGLASLTYQIAWVRLLGLSFGSTSESIGTVLAAFFLGMALGSALAERITRHRINTLTPYIVLEVGIGVSGLGLLPILLHLDGLVALAPAFGTSLSLKFALAFLLLSIPSICMGATFPVLASIFIRREQDVGRRIGQFYSLNTAGAVLGAALSGFVFIPHWGLDGAVFIAAALNLTIVVAGLYFNKRVALPPLDTARTPAGQTAPPPGHDLAPFRARALLVLFATGLTSIATQVGWTKYLSIFTGTTIYGFAAILTVFLSGIAVGSWAMRSTLQRLRSPALALAVLLVLLAASLLVTRAGLSWLPPLYEVVNQLQVPAVVYHGVKYAIVFGLLVVPTFLFGALFPLNLHLYCGNLAGVRARLGTAYAVNMVASVLGATLAGFWLIPAFGTDVLLTVMAIGILVLSLLFVPGIKDRRVRSLISGGAVLTLLAAWYAPHLNYEALIAAVDYKYDRDARVGRDPEFLFLKEGKAGIITLVTYDGVYAKLQTNGINESILHMTDPNQALLVETLLGLVPYMLHEGPETAFVVGFGGGITIRALTLTDLTAIRVVELEPAVVEAGRALAGGEIPVLRDPRVQLDFNDARNSLVVEPRTYDLIVSQPSHPWLAGAAGVYTQEFWGIVRARLQDGGIMAQWLNLFHMDTQTLRAIFQAFYAQFPHGLSFAETSTGDLLLIGSTKPLRFDVARMDTILAQPAIAAMLLPRGIETHRDLLWHFALSRAEALAAAGDAVPNTDTNLLSEVRLAALTSTPTGAENPSAFLRAHMQLDLIPYLGPAAADWLYAQADYYFRLGSYARASMAAEQLATLDPLRGRGVAYERLWRLGRFEAAFALYAQEAEWPNRTHLQQAFALVDVGREDEAWRTIKRIRDPAAYRLAAARLSKKLAARRTRRP